MNRLTLLAAALALAAAPASAATMIPVPGATPSTQAGKAVAETPAAGAETTGEASAEPEAIAYECADGASSLRTTADLAPHTLRLSFNRAGATGTGDIETRLTDAKGAEVLSVTCAGPALLVDLPDGRYKLSAKLGGKTVERNVTIAGGRRWTQVISF